MNDVEGLCASCTSDKYLSERIRKIGRRLKCIGCGKRWHKCIPVGELANDIREVFEKHIEKCEDDHGDDLNFWIQEIASVQPEAAEELMKLLLPDEGERYSAIKDGEGHFFEESATYERRAVFDGEFRYTWESFCFNVKHSARFFSDTAESRLKELLEGIERFETPQGKPCIRSIAPGDAESTLVRARLALDRATIVRIYDDPSTELGAPPGRSRTQVG